MSRKISGCFWQDLPFCAQKNNDGGFHHYREYPFKTVSSGEKVGLSALTGEKVLFPSVILVNTP